MTTYLCNYQSLMENQTGLKCQHRDRIGLEPGNTTAFQWSVLALIILAFGIRAYHLDYQSLWRDEVDAIFFATRDLATMLGNFTSPGQNGPLYFLALRFWIDLTGSSEFSLRFLSLLFGVLFIPLAFTFGRWLLGREVGLLGALFAVLSPYYVWYSQEAKMYALLTFLSLLSVFLYLLALERGKTRLWVSYVVVTSLSLYVHAFVVFLIAFEGLLFLTGLPRWRPAARNWGVSFGFLTLPYIPLAIWQQDMLVHPWKDTFPFLDLGSTLSVLIFAWSFNSTPMGGLFPLIFFVFLLLAGLLLYRPRRGVKACQETADGLSLAARVRELIAGRRGVAILAAYLFVPVVGFFLVSLRLPLFTDRYLIIVSPAYYLLLACGLVAVRQRSKAMLYLCLSVVLVAIVYPLYLQSQARIKSDFRSAARYYDELSGGLEPIVFVVPYVRVAFSYYHPLPFPVRQATCTNQGSAPEEVAANLSKELGHEKRIWLLLSEEESCDQRGLVKGWLDQHGRLLQSSGFARVALYRYELSAGQ